MPREMGYDYSGMSFQEQVAAQGVPASAIFGLSLLFVFLILAAQYKLVAAVQRAPHHAGCRVRRICALWLRAFENNVYAQIGLIMLIGLSAKRDPDRGVRQSRI